MKKRIFTVVSIALLLCLLSVSCSDEHDTTDKLVDVTLVSVVDESKTLTIAGLSKLTKYSYTATPLFTAADDNPEGSKAKDSGMVTTSSQEFKNLSQGKWLFEVTGYNADGKKMYYGKVEKNVTAETGTVSVILGSSYETGTGTLHLSIKAPKVGNKPDLKYTVSDYEGNYAEATTTQSNINDFILEDTITLSQGLHTVIITNYDDKTAVGGEIFTVRIVSGDEVEISGIIDTGTYESVIINAWEFDGEVEADTSDTNLFKFNIKKNAPSDFNTQNVDYTWYLNGVECGSDSTYSFAPTKSGYYCITCIAKYSENSQVIGVSSSSVYRDFVKPEED